MIFLSVWFVVSVILVELDIVAGELGKKRANTRKWFALVRNHPTVITKDINNSLQEASKRDAPG